MRKARGEKCREKTPMIFLPISFSHLIVTVVVVVVFRLITDYLSEIKTKGKLI